VVSRYLTPNESDIEMERVERAIAAAVARRGA